MTEQRSTQRPLESLIASARRITSTNISRAGWSGKEGWQGDAWDMFSLVGELRFLATTLALRLSRAKLYVGELADDPMDDPEPVEDDSITEILDAVGGTPSARAQIISRLGVNLFVVGDGWIVGIPSSKIPPALRLFPAGMHGEEPPVEIDPSAGDGLFLTSPLAETPADEELIRPEADVTDLEWRMLSISEVSLVGSGQIQLTLGKGENERITCKPDEVILIRVWRPHPEEWWRADSPTCSSLPVLRQIVGMTMRSGAEIDSRLAGAGLLVVPSSASRALKIAMGLPEDSEADPFTEALVEAMITPIKDRASASAVVPLVATVPDEAAELIRHLSFATPLDEHAAEQVDQALRRMALGLDAPPEILLGTAGANHWGAWLVQDDVVSTHLEPPLALICDALTTQYLWPVLLEQGKTPEEVRKYVIWYDVSNLVVRPTASQDALVLHDRGVISDAAVRRSTGFDDADDPTTDESSGGLPPEVTMALNLAAKNPALFGAPGLPAVAAQIRALLDGNIPEIVLVKEEPAPTEEPAPSSGDEPLPDETEDETVGDGTAPGAGPLPQPGPPAPSGPNE